MEIELFFKETARFNFLSLDHWVKCCNKQKLKKCLWVYSQNIVCNIWFWLLRLVVDSGKIYDIISNTHGNCFENPRINNTTIDNISRIEDKCPICIHFLPQLCEDLKKSKWLKIGLRTVSVGLALHQWKRILVYLSIEIPSEDPISNSETNSTFTDEKEIDSRGNYSNWIIMDQYRKSTENENKILKYMPINLFLIVHGCFSFKLALNHHKRWYGHR